MSSFTTFQLGLVIVPKCTAFISFCCSFFIVQHVLKSKERRTSAYYRILLGMSLSDLIGSFGYFLSSWPIPYDAHPPVYGARGTTATCTAQGFFQHGGNLSAPLYNASLVTHNLLVITFLWPGTKIKQIEWMFHVLPLLIAWGVAVASVFLDLYNPAHWICFIGEYPEGCKESIWHSEEEANCIRGDNSSIYRIAFLYLEVWATIIYVAIAMFIIYRSVLQTERDMDKYAFDGERKRSGSRKIAQRSLYYVLGLMTTWIFATIVRIWEEIDQYTELESLDLDDHSRAAQALGILMVFFLPLQGFFNFLVYVRPRYSKYRESHPNSSFVDLIYSRFSRSTSRTTSVADLIYSRFSRSSGRTPSGKNINNSMVKSQQSKTASSTRISSVPKNEAQEGIVPDAADNPTASKVRFITEDVDNAKTKPTPLPLTGDGSNPEEASKTEEDDTKRASNTRTRSKMWRAMNKNRLLTEIREFQRMLNDPNKRESLSQREINEIQVIIEKEEMFANHEMFR